MFTQFGEPAMSTYITLQAQPVSSFRQLLRHPLLAPLNDGPAWERLIGRLDPMWSWAMPRARVVRVVNEAPGVRSLWLKPNRRFRGFVPGQHLLLSLEIDGVRHSRCFSLAAAPRQDGLIRLTIRRQAGGRVSTAAHALRVADVVEISQAQGQFAPSASARPLLLVSLGSGVTPMISILQAMAAAGSTRDVVLLHGGRGDNDTIFGTELTELARVWPALRLHLHDSRGDGRMTPIELVRRVPDWQQREALVCGPPAFMQSIMQWFAAHGLRDQVQVESFGRLPAPIDPAAAEHLAHAELTEQSFSVRAGQDLLQAAEAAGLTPRYGCRRGICRTCQCKKLHGSVRNLLTGEVSGAGEELIQLCISTPQSALALAL